jgi:uncharacterized protein YegL
MKDVTDINLLLDRSGSMSPTQAETIRGINAFIEDQKKVPGEAVFSLTQFDDKYEPWITARPLANVEPLTTTTYQPRGWTALLGAVAKAIEDTGARLRAMPEHERPRRVIFVIVTDGQENWSQNVEWARGATKAKVREAIERQRGTYHWEFVFMGANQDAFAEAASIGIPLWNVANYNATPEGTVMAFASASSGMRSYRNAGASLISAEKGYFGGTVNVSETTDDNPDVVQTTTTGSTGNPVVI